MNNRDEVLKEFGAAWNTSGEQAMADEIVKLREELLDVKKERMMIAEWLVDVTYKLVSARFMSAGWKRKANQLEDVNAEWAAEMSRVMMEVVNNEALIKIALPDFKFAAWLLLHASTQKVNEHRSMEDSASILTQHIERIENSLNKEY